jgi:hypothetical protein
MNPGILLATDTDPQSLPYLRALAETSALGEIDTRVIAIPLSGAANSTDAELGDRGGPIVAITPADAITVYAMFARQDVDTANVALMQVDYLIDRQGYIRARWIGVPDSPPNRAAEIFDQAELLRRERQRAPLPTGHTH